MVDVDGRDAIYVVDTSAEEGLPVVGHAFVYTQDDDGNWYKTEYTGVFPDKSTAKVRIMPVSDDEINRILNEEAGDNISYVYISGDFSSSVDKATSYAGSNYSGYNLCFNNCKHYAVEILLEGSFDSKLVRFTLLRSYDPVPIELYEELATASMCHKAWRKISNEAKKFWDSVVEFCD